jgi:hypothetical protein
MRKFFQILTLTLVICFSVCGFAYEAPLASVDPLTTDAEPVKPELKFPITLLDVPSTGRARNDFALKIIVYGPDEVGVSLYGPEDATNSPVSLNVKVLDCTYGCGGRYDGVMRILPIAPGGVNDSHMGFPFRFPGTTYKIKSGSKIEATYEIQYKGNTIANSVVRTVP